MTRAAARADTAHIDAPHADARHVLVTGAAGFIGNACAREFLTRGWRVTALVHRTAPQGLAGATLVRGSLTDRARLAAVLSETGPFDTVVNCAGLATDVAPPAQLMQANFAGTRHLAELLATVPSAAQTRLVHISTTDVYGLRDFNAATEETPFARTPRNAYPRSKICAEQAITASLTPAHHPGSAVLVSTRHPLPAVADGPGGPPLRYVLLRPGAVCGPGDRTILPRVLAFLRSSPRVVYFGRWRGRNRWPLVHVQNVATAAFLAATCAETAGQAYNVVDPLFTSVAAYYDWVLRTFLPERVGLPVICVPLGLAAIYAGCSTLLARALRRTQPLFEPSLYALLSIAANLDFSSRKLEELFARHGERFVPSVSNSVPAESVAAGLRTNSVRE